MAILVPWLDAPLYGFHPPINRFPTWHLDKGVSPTWFKKCIQPFANHSKKLWLSSAGAFATLISKVCMWTQSRPSSSGAQNYFGISIFFVIIELWHHLEGGGWGGERIWLIINIVPLFYILFYNPSWTTKTTYWKLSREGNDKIIQDICLFFFF